MKLPAREKVVSNHFAYNAALDPLQALGLVFVFVWVHVCVSAFVCDLYLDSLFYDFSQTVFGEHFKHMVEFRHKI